MDPLESMRKAGQFAAEILDFIRPHVQPGVTTLELNDLCHDFHIKHGAIPAPLGYNGFPKSICTSINHTVCHGIPNEKKLVDGDIINIDVTPIIDGWHGDSSRMFFVGTPSTKARRLVTAAYDAMMYGIEEIAPGKHVSDIGRAIEAHARRMNYSTVKDYCGHGIGKKFHMDPQIPGCAMSDKGPMLEAGMFITVEPMLNAGKDKTKVLSDNWTVVTRDRSLSAQWEHTIAVTDDGYEILTLSK